MFGLEQIAWADFFSLLASLLVFWYLSLLFMAWWKDNTHQKQMLFEDDADHDFTGSELSLLKVSERDFPSQMIIPISEENVSLVSSFYEETGMDEGLGHTTENTTQVYLDSFENEVLDAVIC